MIIPQQPLEPVDISTPPVRPSPDETASLYGRSLMVPVDGLFPTSLRDNFGAPRGGNRLHAALDIMAPRGTPVVAADSGKVLKVRSNTLGGRTVYLIDHDERFVYYYAHLDRYADGIKEGQRVVPGDVLGYVGTTGNAPPNTPHLHFQVLRYKGNGRWWDGEPLNPFPFLLLPGKANAR